MSKFECCISDDKHFCENPVLLKNNCNVCEKCIFELDCNEIKCTKCLNFHGIKEFNKSILNKNEDLARLMKNESLNQLFQLLKERFNDTIKNLEGIRIRFYFCFMKLHFI